MKKFLKKIFSPIIWGNLLAMAVVAVGLIVGLKYWLDSYTRHGEEIEIPSVTGMTAQTAIDQLTTLGLWASVADSSYDRTLPAGTILDQKPAAGSHVKQGRYVLLTINSANAPTMPLPDIIGNSSTREAQERLRQLGFRLGEVEYVLGDKDWVYGANVNGRPIYNGDRVTIGATITLQVGDGYRTDDSLELDLDELLGEEAVVEDAATDEEVFDYE